MSPLERGVFTTRQKTSSAASLPRPCLITSRGLNEARLPDIHVVGRVRSQGKKKRKKKPTKSCRTQNTLPNTKQHGGRGQLQTTCDETSPTRLPKLARFCRRRVCGNRSRTALKINGNARNADRHAHIRQFIIK